MKSIAVCFITISLLFSACVSRPSPTPYGKWENVDIGLTLDINPELENNGYYPSQYNRDNKVLDVRIFFNRIHDAFYITTNDNVEQLAGSFKIRSEKIYLNLYPKWEEELGKTIIVFDLIEEYETPPPTPTPDYYWLD